MIKQQPPPASSVGPQAAAVAAASGCEGEKPPAINSELWHACAGPLVSLPPAGSLVVYFPQGHCEQVVATMQKDVDGHVPSYPYLPSKLICLLHNVTLHADPDTDEVYARMTLQPVTSYDKEALQLTELALKQPRPQTEFFCKTLTASDTSTHGGFSVPCRAAEKIFPPLDFSMHPPVQEIQARDIHDATWTFRHIYRDQLKGHLLTTGWSLFVSGKRLFAGDSVIFVRDEKQQLLLGIRRANRQPTLSSSVCSSDSMTIGILAAAAHAAANNNPFTIFYNPRASPTGFVVPFGKYQKAFYGTQIALGMRFLMMFETEELDTRRYMGTITGIRDLDPVRWKNSQWRNLQVGWDDSAAGERNRVSMWEIETVAAPFFIRPPHLSNTMKRSSPAFSEKKICPPPFSGSKCPRQLGGFGMAFELEVLRESTDNFSDERLLGEGGFGRVYKAQLQNGDMIAVKKFASILLDINDRQFENEARHLTILRHPNIVQLVGYCSHTEKELVPYEGRYVYAEKRERLLCLEYMPNGSLYGHLSDESSGLDWDIRYKIIEGICHGLHYLHEKWQAGTPIIHMDLKPKNILLDDNMVPKIADFGLSRLFGEEQTRTCTTNRHGTFGYMAPEYFNRGLITKKLDIFSLGVIIIEIMTGRRDYPDETETSSQEFVEHVLKNWRNRLERAPRYTSDLSLFPSLHREIDYQQIKRCIQIGLACVKLDRAKRPTTLEIIDMLHGPDGAECSSIREVEKNGDKNISKRTRNLTPRCKAKVYKRGAVGRSIDMSQYSGYDELKHALARMFSIEGQLEEPQRIGWKLVYKDHEDDILFLGDDPWEEFVNCVRCIRIMSPQEVHQMSLC